MDLKALVTMEIKKGENSYRFLMDNGCPFGEAIDAAFEFLQKLHALSKQAADDAKPVTQPANPSQPVQQ